MTMSLQIKTVNEKIHVTKKNQIEKYKTKFNNSLEELGSKYQQLAEESAKLKTNQQR